MTWPSFRRRNASRESAKVISLLPSKSPEAQQWFDQGLALLHCFWDYEALRSFEQAARLDPDCAMCHWGLSQALDFSPKNHDQAKEELKKAKDLAEHASDLAEHASDLEQRYIRAYSEQAEKQGDEAEKVFTKEMEALIARYPDDIQAKLLLAGQLINGYDSKGDPRPGALYGQAILRNLLQEYPMNAAANHYWIHAVESSDHPESALESAEKLATFPLKIQKAASPGRTTEKPKPGSLGGVRDGNSSGNRFSVGGIE